MSTYVLFFFNDTATTEIYTLSLHDALPIWPWVDEGLSEIQHVYQSATDCGVVKCWHLHDIHTDQFTVTRGKLQITLVRSEEHTSELQSRQYLVCRLLLEKKLLQ